MIRQFVDEMHSEVHLVISNSRDSIFVAFLVQISYYLVVVAFMGTRESFIAER